MFDRGRHLSAGMGQFITRAAAWLGGCSAAAMAAFALWLLRQPDEYRFSLLNGVFRNWERRVSCRPASLARPSTVAEVRAVVRRAAAAGQRVKAVGAGHSWNDGAATDGVMVSLDALDKVLAVDRARMRVTVEGGIRLGPLQDALARDHGLSFTALPSVNEQSAAGAIATATHGNGVRHRNMSSIVTGLELVDGRGNLIRCNEDENAELLPAVRCGLGALGIVVRVTFEVEPLFRLHGVQRPLPVGDVVRDLPRLCREHEYLKYWYSPAAGKAQLYTYDRTTEPETSNAAPWKVWIQEAFLTGYVNNFILWVATAVLPPSKVGALNSFLFDIGFKPRSRVDRSDRLMNVAVKIRHKEIELILPAERAGEVTEAIPGMLEALGSQIDMIVEVRYVAADDNVWLSPSSGRDTVHFTICQYKGDPAPFFSAFERLCRPLGSRPHWGKWFTDGPSELRALYPHWDDWQRVRAQLDPGGIFHNDYLERHVGPVQTRDLERQGAASLSSSTKRGPLSCL